MEIDSTTRSGKSTYVDVIKVTSAYTRSNTQHLINSSNIRFVNENKSRVDDWLKVNRLQLPLPNSQSHSATSSITENEQKVNTNSEKTDKSFALPDKDVSQSLQGINIQDRQDVVTRSTYRYAVDADLLEFVDSISAMKNHNAISKRKHLLGKISAKHAKIVEEVLASELGLKIDAKDYTVHIDGSAVKYIEEKHGANGTSDHSMESREDVARVGWAVNNADSGYIARTQSGEVDYSTHYKNADGTPSPKIILETQIGNGRFIVAECVPDTAAKKIHIISARKIKGGNGQVLNVKSTDSPQPTSETLLDGVTANDSITDNQPNVKRKTEKSAENKN